MPKYKALISYDGSSFSGWQSQINSLSVQDLIEKALATILRVPMEIIGSGRTDAGVHALGQVGHFITEKEIETEKVLYSLNSLLPKEIRILDISEAPEDFHARYSATGKIYHYHLHLDPIMDPFKRKYALHLQHKLDIAELKAAASLFVGTHDFSSFANQQSQGSASLDAVRTLHRLDVIEQPGGIRLEFEGTGFLYKMVRNIVGTLLEVGGGKRLSHEIPYILSAKDRKKAGRAAEPHGLFLVKVFYS